MHRVLSIILIAVLIVSLCCSAAFTAEAGKEKLLDNLKVAGESLNSKDLEALSSTITKIYDKYKFSDTDISELGTQAAALVFALSDFSEKMQSTKEKVEAPHSEMKKFFGALTSFLRKYKVSAEDTLSLGRDVAIVAMGAQEKGGAPAEGKGRSFSREDMMKISSRLVDFSKKHNIQAEDLVPIIENLGDMGISVMQNEEMKKKLEKADPRKVKESLGDFGVSQDQVVSLVKALMGFQKKYKIEFGQMLQLVDDVRKMLK